MKIVEERIQLFDCQKKGWVMEGFHQIREQAIAMQAAGIYPKHCGKYRNFNFITNRRYFSEIFLCMGESRHSSISKW